MRKLHTTALTLPVRYWMCRYMTPEARIVCRSNLNLNPQLAGRTLR